jgi:hypothetical protein
MDTSIFDAATVLGGIAFDPHIRAILVVLTGAVILFGSIWLILGTNVGTRLGFLLSLGGIFGWMTIIGITWWLTPPAIGPRGETPSWEVVDIVRGDPSAASAEVVHDLPNTCWSSVSAGCEAPEDGETVSGGIIAGSEELQAEFGDEAAPTLSEFLTIDPDAAEGLDFGEWELVSTADSGEALAAADEELRALGVFETSADYIVLDGWEQGGKEPLPENPTRIDRIVHKITSTAQITHPTHYAVIQLIPVVPQTAEPGEAPPPPIPNTEQPVLTIVMERNLGNLRVPAALVTLGSALMLGVICYALHRRDQLTDEHLAAG